MALTACKECGQSVSTAANACPHCGKPGPSGVDRRLKGHMLLGLAMLVIGLALMLFAYKFELQIGGTLLFLAGLAWNFIARGRAWWRRG